MRGRWGEKDEEEVEEKEEVMKEKEKREEGKNKEEGKNIMIAICQCGIIRPKSKNEYAYKRTKTRGDKWPNKDKPT